MKITFLDAYTINPDGQVSLDAIRRLGTLEIFDRTAPQDVVPRAKDSEIVIINKVRLGESEFAALPRLRLVCVAATGYDVVDVEAARRHGVLVTNCAGYSSRSVAQSVLAFLLETANHVGDYAERVRQGHWSESQDFCFFHAPLTELYGKRAAIVGVGAIGSTVLDVLRPLGLRLYAVTSKRPEDLPADVQKISLAEAFRECDIVSLHTPLTATNRQMVGAALLEGCNPNLVLINTARGALIDDLAVSRALHKGRLGCYCADVLSAEPPAADHPLLTAPRTLLTPHIAWATPEARARIVTLLAQNIEGFLAGKPRSVVNG